MGWFGLVWSVGVGLVMVCVVGSVVVVVFEYHSFPLFPVLSSGLRPLPSSPPTFFLLFLSLPPGVWYGGVGCGRLRRDGMG